MQASCSDVSRDHRNSLGALDAVSGLRGKRSVQGYSQQSLAERSGEVIQQPRSRATSVASATTSVTSQATSASSASASATASAAHTRGLPAKITNNTNKKFDMLPDHLRFNGVTPSGKPRLFVCKVCTRAFARQEHLTRHERSHTKEKPYVCGICERRFTRRDLLIRHCQKLHGGNCGDYIRRTSRKVRKDSRRNSSAVPATVTVAGPSSSSDLKSTPAFTPTPSTTISPRSDSSSATPVTTRRVHKRSFKRDHPTNGNGNGNGTAVSATAAVKRDAKAATATDKDFLKQKRLKMNRRISFSAQSGENYAILPQPNDLSSEKPERVDFSTPQMLPLDLFDSIPQLDEPTNFNLLDRNNWINDFNNAVIPGTDDQSTSKPHSNSVSDSSPNLNSTKNSSWELQGDRLKINSLFSFPMSHGDSQQSTTDWRTLATALKPEADQHGSATDNATEQITDSLRNFQIKFNDDGNRNIDINMNVVNSGNKLQQANTTINPSLTSTNNHAKDGIENGNFSKVTMIQNGIPTESSPIGNDANLGSKFKFMLPPAFTPTNDPLDVSAAAKSNLPIRADHDYLNNTNDNNNNNATFNEIHDHELNNALMKNHASPFPKIELQPNLHHSNLNLHNGVTNTDIGPGQLHSIMDPGYTFYDVQYSQPCNISKASPAEQEIKIDFFNDDIRRICENSLVHYSNICGQDYKPCSLTCSNDELNTYLKLYVLRFHPHNPFIHSSIWTLSSEAYRSYIYEHDAANISPGVDEMIYNTNIICLPLFAATIGSLYKNTASSSTSKTKELYEIARRALHVYLDRRKNLKRDETTLPLNSNLWLIQSLTLSVMYSIFAENNNSNINRSDQILKQVGAVCSLLRNYFLPLAQQKPGRLNSEADIIIWESKLRTTLTNYNLCQFLQIFHRLTSSSFITNFELQTIMIPNNETRWSTLSFNWNSTSINSEHLYHLNFLHFFQSFQFNDLGCHTIPEMLVNSMLFYEYSIKLSGSTVNVFINKIDTGKLEKNLPQIDQDSATSDCLIGDAINLKNSLISLRLFDKLDPHFFRIISKYGLTDDIFEHCLSPIHANILSKDSDSLIIDLLISVNVSMKNIASLFYFTNETGYYQEIKFDCSKTSLFQVQGYFFNFLCILKFILDFESTPNFKVLSIFAELRKLIEQLVIPKLINNYPLEFSKFHDIRLVNDGPTPEIATVHNFSLNHLEKTIESVLVHSFNDNNYLKMPVGQANGLNEFEFDSVYPERTPKPSKSSINLLRHHDACKQNGARTKQGFYDRYHLSDKLLQAAKCSFLLIYESHVHGSLLTNFIDIINTIQSKLDNQRKITNIIINEGHNVFGQYNPHANDHTQSFVSMLNLPNSNTPPGDYYFNPNSL
ncbi:unnamed protein product [Kluyveromyces dobzhanskii CBS 2104]|uniref:WGS project CCBQ000000000 data, contig 00010 n=1 Tax=Kluyveromyces dobzhanskii CBS 2104 TaxID=1427455 RepID=A0A0A8LCU1_9SACH|nr:unnamed protein product [Kluyveromyces dobzhanskii CBS 2104]